VSARSPYLASGNGHAIVLTGLLAVSALHRPPAIVPGVRIVTLPGGPRHGMGKEPKPPAAEKPAPPAPPQPKPAVKPSDTAPPTREAAKMPDPKGAKAARKPEVVSKTPTKPAPRPASSAGPSVVTPTGAPVVVPGTGASGVGFEAEGDPGPLAGYLELLRDKVAANWAPPPSVGRSGIVRTVVYFVIPRAGGEPQQMVVQEGSGSSFFDRAALSAVLTSAPLQPLPSAWPEDSIAIKFTFHQEY
jgi:outer membrane biosynthesis protein TonB